MANKKITELPFITTLTGSSVFDNPSNNTVVPVVLYGTTNQITVENFAKYINLYNAHTGSAGNTFTGPQTINNNVTINGRLRVNEIVAQYETASILFSTGSTKLGDQLTDKHEFTGSTNITGSLTYNGVIVGNIDADTIYRLQQTTQSIQVATASLQAHSASVDSQLLSLQQTTQSLQVATASINTFTASQDSRNFVISQYTSSTDVHIVGISAFTSSQLAVNLGNAIYTASVDSHIVGISTYTSSVRDTLARVYQSTASLQTFTASQDDRNFVVSQVTGSLIGITNGLMAFTAALDNTYATDAQLYQLYQATRSIELHSGSMVGVTNGLMSFSSSQLAVNLTISSVTGSLIGITNGLMAFTAALDNTYATDAQLYQLYQATKSLELHSGSMIDITNALMAFTAALDSTYATDAQLYQLYQATRSLEIYTGSNESWKDGIRGEVSAIEAYTASLKGQAIVSSSTQVQNYDVFALNSNLYTSTGSLIGITNGLMAFTAALDNTYATDAQLYQLYAETASIKAEIAGIEAYTASLKGQTIVSSSTQIQNYDVFALNANLYNGTGSIKGEIAGIEAYTASLKGAIEISGQNVNVLGMITAQQFNVTYVSSSVIYQSGSTKLGNSSDDKHEITGSLYTSFGGNGGLFVNDGFQKIFTFPTGNLFSIDFGSAEGGGFVDVTYGGIISTIGGRGGATRYALSYKDASNVVATKVHGYGDDIVSASISATKVAIFSISGDAVQSAKYQVNVSVNAVAADGGGNYEVIQYNRL